MVSKLRLPALLATSGVLALAAGSRELADPAPAGREADAVGAGCIACHREIVEAYRGTGMARAVDRLRDGELAGLDAVADADTGFVYRFEQDGEGARVAELFRRPGEAALEHVRSAPLEFAIGAGLVDRSYAARLDGRLWFAPLEVLSAGPGRARHTALAPGHEIVPGTRFTTPITEECLGCHTDRLPPRGYPPNAVPAPDAWTPRGISCDACHGDGEAHAGWRRRDLVGGEPEGPDPIVNPAHLGLEERLSVCARCHLQGDASFSLVRGHRGIEPLGGDLLERRAVFVPERPTDDVPFVGQVERLVLSPCYVESRRSPRPLDCTSCHDPHYSGFGSAERERVRAACLLCHPGGAEARPERSAPCSLPPAEREGDCASCHMRRTQPFDLSGVEIHDHYIRSRPGPPADVEAIRLKESTDGRLALFAWPGAEAPAHAGDPGLSMMALYAARFPDLAAGRVDEPAGDAARFLPAYHHMRGSLLERLGRLEEARKAYRRALILDRGYTESKVNLGLVLARLGRVADALEVLDEVVLDHPLSDEALRNRAVARSLLGDAAGFAADLEAAHRLRPRAENAAALAEHAERAGEPAAAEAWRAEALRLDPRRSR